MKEKDIEKTMGNPGKDNETRQRRLEEARARTFSLDMKKTREETEKILKNRAALLAKDAAAKAKKASAGSYEAVEFALAHERYALESAFIREICNLTDITPVPGAPDFVLGIINVRSRIISVVDIKRFYGLPEKGLTDMNKVIILEGDEMEFGVVADAVIGVRVIDPDTLEKTLPTLTGIREIYLKGITKDRVIVLDAGKLLNDKNMVVKDASDA